MSELKSIREICRGILKKRATKPARSNWTPLLRLVGEEMARDFMYMGDAQNLDLYKHVNTRKYLNIDRDTGQTFRFITVHDKDRLLAGELPHYEAIPVFQAITEVLSWP